jgi:hypothetical protein
VKPVDISGTKRWNVLKDIINEIATNSKNKNIRDLLRGINEFKRVYQPRSNLIKVEKCDLLVSCHKIFNGCENYFLISYVLMFSHSVLLFTYCSLFMQHCHRA